MPLPRYLIKSLFLCARKLFEKRCFVSSNSSYIINEGRVQVLNKFTRVSLSFVLIMKLLQYNFVTKIQIESAHIHSCIVGGPNGDIIKLIKCLNSFDTILVRLFKHFKVCKQCASFGHQQKMYSHNHRHVNVVICAQYN